jgi:hypothetical protein
MGADSEELMTRTFTEIIKNQFSDFDGGAPARPFSRGIGDKGLLLKSPSGAL